jgi:hypothetical protein
VTIFLTGIVSLKKIVYAKPRAILIGINIKNFKDENA